MSDYAGMMRRQQVLADFGEFALRSQDLDNVLNEACRLVGEALGTGRAKILEIQEDGKALLVRAGVGWDPGIVGRLRIPMEECSSESFSIDAAAPVVSQDINKEDRFEVPPFMKEVGIVALVNVPVFLPGGRPYGLLQVDAAEPRDFGEDEIQFLRTYATILGPVIDRLLLAGALRSSEERFRLTVEAALDYAIFLTDPQDRITDWLPGAQAVFGWTAEEAVGQPSAMTFTPEDRKRGKDEKEIEVATKEGVATNIRWHVRKDGRRVFIEGSTRVLRDPDGTLRGFLKIGQDVTKRRVAEERLHTLIEGIPQLVWRATGAGHWTWSSPQWSAFTGLSAEQSLGLGWLQALHPDDRGPAMRLWEVAEQAGHLSVERRIFNAAQGSHRWFQSRATPLREGTGRIVEWLGTSTDIHDLRELQERQKVLVAELQHRTRNLMGVVRSVIEASGRSSVDLDDFRDRIRDRIDALARVQGLLSRLDDHDRVTFDELIKAELAAMSHTAAKVQLSGPEGIRLRSTTVQTLALALHELATNAVKYGALGQAQARLSVTWWFEPSGEEGLPWLHIQWRETGVVMPPHDASPRGTGQGRELIERALPYQFDARTSYVLGPDGACCTIAIPVSESNRSR
jgi:PAS domain S-box-containing protein